MRILFTTQPAYGHFHPLVPLAQATVTAGHEVAFASSPSFRSVVETSGFRWFSAGPDWLEGQLEVGEDAHAYQAAVDKVMTVPPEMRPAAFVKHVFAEMTAPRMVANLMSLCATWKPDVLVREPWEYGCCIAAESLGLPHAAVHVGAFEPPEALEAVVGAELNRLRVGAGLAPDPKLEMLYRYLHLSFVPPSYRDPEVPLPPTTHALRTFTFDRSGNESLPGWVQNLPKQPTVYATLGTVFNRRPAFFQAMIEGLRDEAVNLILTVGHNQDPAQFGSQPPNVHIERYIPQTLLLTYCDLVITHGGFNTVMAALVHGLPLIVIPIAADQPENARRCAALGVGRVVEPAELTPEALREAVLGVLKHAAYRENARRLQEEMLALPGVAYAVERLERLGLEV